MMVKVTLPYTATADEKLLLSVMGGDLGKDGKGRGDQAKPILQEPFDLLLLLFVAPLIMKSDAL